MSQPDNLTDEQAKRVVEIVDECVRKLKAAGAVQLAWDIRLLPSYINIEDRAKGRWS